MNKKTKLWLTLMYGTEALAIIAMLRFNFEENLVWFFRWMLLILLLALTSVTFHIFYYLEHIKVELKGHW